MYETIVVAIDGSDHGRRAAELAVDIGDTFEATVQAVYVVDTPRYGGTDAGEVDLIEDLETRGADTLEDLESQFGVSTAIRTGRPHQEIIEQAEEADADLLVLGNRGLGGEDGDEIGSVAERVVRHAGRPVLTA